MTFSDAAARLSDKLKAEAAKCDAEAVPDGLVKRLVDQGAKIESVESAEFGKTKSIRDALGDGKIHFHEELPKVKFEDLLGVEFRIVACQLQDKWDGQFGTSKFYLLLIVMADGSRCTTLAGGKAILNQMAKLTARKLLPVRVMLTERDSVNGPYYLFE